MPPVFIESGAIGDTGISATTRLLPRRSILRGSILVSPNEAAWGSGWRRNSQLRTVERLIRLWTASHNRIDTLRVVEVITTKEKSLRTKIKTQ